MGCRHSKDATLVHRMSALVPLQPVTPSFHAQDTKGWASTAESQPTDNREELPSFVVSDSVDLIGSSDGEPVHGLVSAFTFSFIQVSESSSNSSCSSPSVSSELASPGPSESFALAGDPVELLPIPEERSGPKDGTEVLISPTVEPAQTPSESDGVEPDGEVSPPAAAMLISESSAVSTSAVTESSDMLMNDLDVSGVSHSSDDGSDDKMRPIALSLMSENNEYMVTETGLVVCQEPRKEPVSEASVDDRMQRESIQELVAAMVQDVINDAVTGTTSKQQQALYRAVLDIQSSVQVESSSSGVFFPSMKAQPPNSRSSRCSMYAVVGTSTEKGIVQYHVQLVGDSAEPVPLHRRYSRFLEMYLKLKESKLPSAEKLPQLSRAGVVHFVRGRQSRKTIEERQEQFSNLLCYIAEHRELHDSAAFQTFLTQ